MKKEIMMSFGHIGHMHRYAADEMLSQRGVSVGQPPILRYLSEHDGCIQRDLAEHCRVRPASISSVLDKMELDGYIERRGAEGDKRVQHVFMTEAGRAKQAEIRTVFQALEDVCLDGIDEGKQEVLLAMLKKITANIDRFNQSKGES